MKPRNGRGSQAGGPNARPPSTAVPSFDLDSAIRSVRAEQGSAAQALALEQRLAETLGPAALAGASGASGVAGAWGSGGWLLVLGLGALGALALHAYEGAQPRTASVLHAEPPVQAPRVAALAPVQLPEAAAPALAPLPATHAKPAQARRAPRHARAAGNAHAASNTHAASNAHAASDAPAAVDAEGELALLQRSRAALRGDPVAALALAEQHARAYPHGMFAQEREVLAVEALLRSHARAAAFARAHAFVGSHPDSPYAPRIRALLAQLPADPAAEPPER